MEHIYPDYSLYPSLTKNIAYGFLTRGCPRNCPFCIVGQKEGTETIKHADLEEFWKGQKQIKLLDANLLACQEHKELLRHQIVQSLGYRPFIMIYQKKTAPKITRDLQCWANNRMIYEATKRNFKNYSYCRKEPLKG